MQQTNLHGDHLTEQELIRKYLDNELTQEEEIMVAERYEKDAEFRDALDGMEMMSGSEFSEIMSTISDEIDTKINAAAGSGEVVEISDSGAGSSNVFRLQSVRRMAIAASVVLLMFLGGTIVMNQIKSPIDKLVASNFEAKPYPDLILRGEAEDLSELEKVAIREYNAENYEVSVKHFSNLSIQYPDIQKYGLFLGISHMSLSDYTAAVETLLAVKAQGDGFSDDIDWYLGLSYLKLKQADKAKPLFERLAANDQSYYSAAAEEIATKLK